MKVAQQVWSKLEERLALDGFEHLGDGEFRHQQDSEWSWSVYMPDAGEGRVVFRPWAAIRSERIQAIVNRATCLPAEIARETPTATLDLGPELEASHWVGVHLAARAVLRRYQRLARPFFESACSYEKLSEILNTDLDTPCHYASNLWVRAATGCTTAFMVGKLEERLIAAYRGRLATYDQGVNLLRYDRLIDALRGEPQGGA